MVWFCWHALYRGTNLSVPKPYPKPLSSRPTTKELATEAEWRDPEAVSSPMPIQGVSTRTSSPLVPYARFAGIDRSLQVTFSDSAPVATLHPLRNAFLLILYTPPRSQRSLR